MGLVNVRARLVSGLLITILVLSIIIVGQLPGHANAAASLTETPIIATNGAATFSPTATAGNLLIAICSTNAAATITAPTGYSTAINESSNPAQGIFYKVASGGEGSTSCTFSAGTNNDTQILEYSGIENVSPLNAVTAGGSTGSSTTASSGSVTTTNANDLLVAAIFSETVTTITTWQSPFTQESNGQISTGAKTDRIAYASADHSESSTGTYSTTATVGSATWRGQIAAFKIAPAVTFNGDIVDGSGNSVSSPSVAMTTKTIGFTCQTSTGTLGTSTEKIRVTNTTPADKNGWTLTMAATSGISALWTSGSNHIDFNDSGGSGCTDSDSDGYGGQLTVDPTSETITPESAPEQGCTTTGVSPLGSATVFTGSTPVTIASAGSTASYYCYWDITGLTLSQKIPKLQPSGSYSIGFTLTLTAL